MRTACRHRSQPGCGSARTAGRSAGECCPLSAKTASSVPHRFDSAGSSPWTLQGRACNHPPACMHAAVQFVLAGTPHGCRTASGICRSAAMAGQGLDNSYLLPWTHPCPEVVLRLPNLHGHPSSADLACEGNGLFLASCILQGVQHHGDTLRLALCSLCSL